MPTYITTAGFKLLKDEFEHLKSVERPKVAMGCKREQRVPKFQKRRRKATEAKMPNISMENGDCEKSIDG